MQKARTLKCMLVGPSCGKTTYLRTFRNGRVLTGPMAQIMGDVGISPTMGVSVDVVDLAHKDVIFNVWEVGDTHRGSGIATYSRGADCAIVYVTNISQVGPYVSQLPAGIPYVVVVRGSKVNPFEALLV